MAMREEYSQTSLPFSILIIELWRRVGVPQDDLRNIEITSSLSTNIWSTKTKYTPKEVGRRREATADTSLKVDVNSIPVEHSLPIPTSESLATIVLFAANILINLVLAIIVISHDLI